MSDDDIITMLDDKNPRAVAKLLGVAVKRVRAVYREHIRKLYEDLKPFAQAELDEMERQTLLRRDATIGIDCFV